MVSLFLSLILFTQAAAAQQEPSEVRSGVNQPRLVIPIALTIEGGAVLPPNAGAQVPIVRLVPVKDGKAIETALASRDISITLTPGAIDEYRVEIENLPQGYTVKSVKFGSKDLTKGRLTTPDFARNLPRITTYTGRGELQALIDSIMARQSRVLSITIAPSPTN